MAATLMSDLFSFVLLDGFAVPVVGSLLAPKPSPDVSQLFVAGNAIAFAHRIKQQTHQEAKCNSNN